MSSKSNKGYLYCLYNKVFQQYFTDYTSEVYKLGRTNNLDTRLKHYTTSYIEPSKFLYTSKLFHDQIKAERILFFLLRNHRIRNKREFFKCKLSIVIDIIKQIEELSESQINHIYTKINNKICPSNILDKINDEEYNKLLDFDYSKLDEFFERFRYRPNNKNNTEYVSPEQIQLLQLSH